MKFISWLSGAALLASSALVVAADKNAEEKVRSAISNLAPGMQIDSIEASPMAGFYEVVLGSEVVYVSEDGRYLVRGQVYDMVTRTDIAEKKLSQGRRSILDQFEDSDMLVYSPAEVKHSITVFSDIDCGYCRKLHREMNEYHAEGIEVKYMLYPRAGQGSDSYKKAVSVWCAKDKEGEFTKAKAGANMPDRKCEHPVVEHMEAAQKLGLRGTPMIVTETGEVISGYVPAAELSKRLK